MVQDRLFLFFRIQSRQGKGGIQAVQRFCCSNWLDKVLLEYLFTMLKVYSSILLNKVWLWHRR